MCNNGCIAPKPGFLAGLREICDAYGIALIFDEVICGFRVAPGGAQEYFGITPDLSVFGKAIASGHPISAIVGKMEWMDAIARGSVVHAGTMNSGHASVAAALATLEILENRSPYARIFQYGERLMTGLKEAAVRTKQNLVVQGLGPIIHTGFSDCQPAKDFRDILKYDKARLSRFIAGMHDRGIRVIGRGLWYISAAHKENDIDQAVEAAGMVLESI